MARIHRGKVTRPSCPSHSHRPPLAPLPMSGSQPLIDAAGRAGGLRPNLRRAARAFGRAVSHPMSAPAPRRAAPRDALHGCAHPICVSFLSSASAGPRKRLRGAQLPEKTGRHQRARREPTKQLAACRRRDRKRRPRPRVWQLALDDYTVLCPD